MVCRYLKCTHIGNLIKSRIYDTGEFSDLTVILGDNRFKLHKAVVCGQSSYLRRLTLDEGVSYQDISYGL